jgi:hypothetical protein
MKRKVKIYFQDEAPRLGCGWRFVTAQIGRKWVRLRDDHGRCVRFTRDQYAQLKPQAVERVTTNVTRETSRNFR